VAAEGVEVTTNDVQQLPVDEVAASKQIAGEPALRQPPGSPGPAARLAGRLGLILPRRPLSPAGVASVATMSTVAVLGLWFVFYALVLSGLQENHTQHVMYSQLRQELALATVPIGGAIKPGTPVGLIQAPEIGLSQVVVEGTSSADLTKGPGHLASTPLPGQAGISVIFGRSATFGAPFHAVHDLRAGAIITVTTGQGAFKYRVLDVRGPGDPLPSVAGLGQSSLTLETTAGRGWRSGWAPNEVIYADARLVKGQVQAAPAGRPAYVPTVDDPLTGDTTDAVLYPLILGLFGLLLVSVGLGYAYTRWTLWQVWFVGLPAVVAMLWIVSNMVMLLLPNLA